ncbi:MAG: tRNA (adenosine(37)-N6)-threonylcarbamoyltransferase complex dimerization subunit type 1 TsaB [Prochlorococcaceae cyanobacterium]
MSSAASPWLLALHSSSEVLGVGLQRLGGSEPPRLQAFPEGRGLSNSLLGCVEELLPAADWPSLGRLAVATGPGGFTGTRLTVVFARTLAQQLQLPLDGVSSFLLIARRLLAAAAVPAGGKGQPAGGAGQPGEPFWLLQELPRRGVVAGRYAPDRLEPGGVAELEQPRLFSGPEALPAAGRLPAQVLLPHDVGELLAISQARAAAGLAAPWQPVLPLYPTSPVDPR